MQDFDGKVAVITGGASGIGLGMARALGDAGMRLVLADLDEAAMAAASAEFTAKGIEVVTERCDVSSHAEIQALADTTIATYGAVHVLCNNAGIGIPTHTHRMKLSDWKWIIDVCLWGPIYGIEVFLPLIEEQGEGHINATSSMAGLIAQRTMGAYNVAKHGVVALMATLERELRKRESPVRASVLCPGPVNTAINRHSVEYRPGHTPPPADAPPTKTAQRMQELLEAGTDPDEVGIMVRDAIANEEFWVLTHPHWVKAVRNMVDRMEDDRGLTKA
ncbi:MAG: SDR family NAD(P)-dependent oxidoreductase [Actinomycetota bacterium]